LQLPLRGASGPEKRQTSTDQSHNLCTATQPCRTHNEPDDPADFLRMCSSHSDVDRIFYLEISFQGVNWSCLSQLQANDLILRKSATMRPEMEPETKFGVRENFKLTEDATRFVV